MTMKGGDPDITLARQILQGKDQSVEDGLALAERLIRKRGLGTARRLLAKIRSRPEIVQDPARRLHCAQRHAFCTYRDSDLPAVERLRGSLEILKGATDPSRPLDQITLGLMGAIHKCFWELEGRREQLETSLALYRRGYALGSDDDWGASGINTAFILDVLASLQVDDGEVGGSLVGEVACGWRAEARKIRGELIAVLPPRLQAARGQDAEGQWAWYATVAEAFFGLERYDEAVEWLRRGERAVRDLPAWEFEATIRQLTVLARLQGPQVTEAAAERSAPWQALECFLGADRAKGLRTLFTGKVGLALSGGGFRASLFHIGVLAQLAERDMLRHVEVLSCVSGGSIVGAQYYLELRRLLETKPDGAIERDDYVRLVQKLARDFLAGVQMNIRTRVVGSVMANLRMILRPEQLSRTERAGELYERLLFARALDPAGGKRLPIWLDSLLIQPRGEAAPFAPKSDNWRRQAKVPILVLNATPLNTGHNWQFTASWMGEPPVAIDTDVDGNERLRRMYYVPEPATSKGARRVRLGTAVAASACVPGLFDPIALPGLYPERTVRLVDGGVHDNQGVVSLLEQGCTVLLVSDASGQMSARKDPGQGPLAAVLRSNSILMARVREAEFHELRARRRGGLLQGFMFLHLKKDLDVDPVDWLECEDPYDASTDPRAREREHLLTRYGVRKDVQSRLADLRTDLDSFHAWEAYALMTSGYRMAEHEFGASLRGFPTPAAPKPAWAFLQIEPPMQDGAHADHAKLMRLLEVGSQRAFRIWRLSRGLQAVGVVLALAGMVGMAWIAWVYRERSLLTVGSLGLVAAIALGGVVLGKTLMKVVRLQEALLRVGAGMVMATLGWGVAWVHLKIFDRWFLRWGGAGLPLASPRANVETCETNEPD